MKMTRWAKTKIPELLIHHRDSQCENNCIDCEEFKKRMDKKFKIIKLTKQKHKSLKEIE